MTDEARLRSAYADQPEYPAPAPAPAASYAQPSPAPQTYAPPAPSAVGFLIYKQFSID